jgi:hypothetical protein
MQSKYILQLYNILLLFRVWSRGTGKTFEREALTQEAQWEITGNLSLHTCCKLQPFLIWFQTIPRVAVWIIQASKDRLELEGVEWCSVRVVMSVLDPKYSQIPDCEPPTGSFCLLLCRHVKIFSYQIQLSGPEMIIPISPSMHVQHSDWTPHLQPTSVPSQPMSLAGWLCITPSVPSANRWLNASSVVGRARNWERGTEGVVRILLVMWALFLNTGQRQMHTHTHACTHTNTDTNTGIHILSYQ